MHNLKIFYFKLTFNLFTLRKYNAKHYDIFTHTSIYIQIYSILCTHYLAHFSNKFDVKSQQVFWQINEKKIADRTEYNKQTKTKFEEFQSVILYIKFFLFSFI